MSEQGPVDEKALARFLRSRFEGWTEDDALGLIDTLRAGPLLREPEGEKWSRITKNGHPLSNWTQVSEWDDTPRFGEAEDGWAMEHATLIIRVEPTPPIRET